MTQLLTLEFDDDTGTKRRLRREEILTYLNLIASAGTDTTSRLIGWTGKLLGEHPDQRRELLQDPSLIPNAIEEVLRCEPPPYHFGRYVTQDVELYGQTVPAGSIMVVLPGSANHDDRRFRTPTASTSTATSPGSSVSASAPICASAPTWPGWRAGSSSRRCSRGSRTGPLTSNTPS